MFWPAITKLAHIAGILYTCACRDRLIGIVSHSVPIKFKEFGRYLAFAKNEIRVASDDLEVALPRFKNPRAGAEAGNIIDGPRLVEARQSFVSITNANNQRWCYSSSIWDVANIFRPYRR